VAFTAKDVQALRQATGVGFLDAKKALESCDGDMEEARKWLRVQGKASAAKRADREAGEGAVAVVRNGNVAAMVEMRCETDFVAKSEEFVSLVDEIAARVCAEGTDAVSQFDDQIEKLLTTLKENISIGRVYRLEAGDDEVVDTYIHQQAGRGVNGVLIVVKGASEEVAHEIAVHAAFTKPLYLNREDVPQSEIDASARRSKRSLATRASPKQRCPRSSKVE